ncbi:hypothetical protein DUI87_12926 [Hirundo rustica rustica]|uniref:Uncharacterized protein n=1 Tax=Hirundo rustica rustica TaxID=333673 RepID=A0A3M0KAI7_HIRRU|nr:hypothetical protein DUI87_12926 [Hirundo rustica rustica]
MLESSAMERELIYGKLNMRQQCPGSQEDHPCPGGIRHSIASQAREGIVLLCSALGQPHIEYFVHFGTSQYKKDIKLLESVRRRAISVVEGFERKPFLGVAKVIWAVQPGGD